jgi:hypothetical protein
VGQADRHEPWLAGSPAPYHPPNPSLGKPGWLYCTTTTAASRWLAGARCRVVPASSSPCTSNPTPAPRTGRPFGPIRPVDVVRLAAATPTSRRRPRAIERWERPPGPGAQKGNAHGTPRATRPPPLADGWGAVDARVSARFPAARWSILPVTSDGDVAPNRTTPCTDNIYVYRGNTLSSLFFLSPGFYTLALLFISSPLLDRGSKKHTKKK